MASSDEEIINTADESPEIEEVLEAEETSKSDEILKEGDIAAGADDQETESLEETTLVQTEKAESEENLEVTQAEPQVGGIEAESQHHISSGEQVEEPLSEEEKMEKEEEEWPDETKEEEREGSEPEQESIWEQTVTAEEKELSSEKEQREKEETVATGTTTGEALAQDDKSEGYDVASDRTYNTEEDTQSAVLEDIESSMFRKFQAPGEPEGEEEERIVTPEPIPGAVDLTDVTLETTKEEVSTAILKQRESMDFMDESFWEPRRRDRTIFSERCQRGDYPFRLVQTPQGTTLEWVLAVKDLDYRYYLPEFIRGLKEPDARFLAIANLCVHDMIATDKNKVKMALPYIMNDLYDALSSRFPAICINACKVVQKLAKVVGKQLGFYFDRLFGILNTMRLRIEYVEGQKSFIKHRDMSLHPLYEEILTTWCRLQDILNRLSEKEMQRMMRYWIRPLPWLTF